MIDVFAMMKYWLTWPARHKLETAKAGYKAPRRGRKRKAGERSPIERGVEIGLTAKVGSQIALAPGQPASRVIPFHKLPSFVQEALQKDKVADAGNSTNR